MHIHFLGTNGWYNTETGETACILIDAAEGYIILDAGNGLRKIDRHITSPTKPIYLFLSHCHLDHTYGLHILPRFRFPQGLTIIGQPGTEAQLRTLLAPPWTAAIDQLPMSVTIREVAAGTHTTPVPFTCLPLVHSIPCFGYRLTLEGKIITYCTDTGRCDHIVTLGRNADLLISECTWKQPNQFPNWPHLDPIAAAELAHQAGAKQLALTHFEAAGYTCLEDRTEAQTRAQTIFSNTRAMRDDESVVV